MGNFENKIRKRRIFSLLLALLITITGYSIFFGSEFLASARDPVEYGDKMNIMNIKLLPGSTNMKYVKSSIKGNKEYTVYTIVEGNYTPINLDFFLKPHVKDKNTQFTLISPRSKIIYAVEDIDDNRTLQLNTLGASMEPIMFESSEGEYIGIRYSKSFLEENNIPLAENHEIFEVGTDKEDGSKIPKELDKFIYFDGRRGNLVAVTSSGIINSDDMGKINEGTLNDNTITNSNVFNVGVLLKESDKPEFLGEVESKDTENSGEIFQPGKVDNKQENTTNPNLDAEIEKALEEQRKRANEQRNSEGNEADDPVLRRNENGDLVVSKKDLPGYDIKTKGDLARAMREFPKTYGLVLTPEFLRTLPSATLEEIYKDASVHGWNNEKIIKSIFSEIYKKEVKDKNNQSNGDRDYILPNRLNGYISKSDLRNDYINKAWKEANSVFDPNASLDSYKNGQWYNPLTQKFEDVIDYNSDSLDANGNRKTRNPYRFKWGRIDRNNLNGLTDENNLLLRNVYNYWDVNLVDTNMNKLDSASLVQIPSEQLIPSTIEFEPIETNSTVLFKLSVFGLATTITYVAIFLISRKINQRKSVEEFQKDTLFKMEKINLEDFNSPNFDFKL